MASIKIKTIEPYENVAYSSLNERENQSRHGAQFFSNVKQLQVGYGSTVFRVDRDGMWAGAERFADAPWSVDWEGNMIANSVTIAGYLQDGEALGDIGVGNITGTYIANGAIVTDKLAANAVTAAKISVAELSAISANIGTINAGSINGITITGGTVRTSSSSTRVEMNGSANRLEVYQSGALRVSIANDTISLRNSGGSIVGNLFAGTTNFFVQSTNNMEVSASSVLDLRGGTKSIIISSSGISMGDDVDMNNYEITDASAIELGGVRRTSWPSAGTTTLSGLSIDTNKSWSGYRISNIDRVSLSGVGSYFDCNSGYIDDCRAIYMETGRSTNPSISGEMRYFDGGSKGFRGHINGFTGQFDLSAI